MHFHTRHTDIRHRSLRDVDNWSGWSERWAYKESRAAVDLIRHQLSLARKFNELFAIYVIYIFRQSAEDEKQASRSSTHVNHRFICDTDEFVSCWRADVIRRQAPHIQIHWSQKLWISETHTIGQNYSKQLKRTWRMCSTWLDGWRHKRARAYISRSFINERKWK